MRVDTHVTGGTRKRLSLAVGNMLLGFGVAVLFGHSKVDDMNDVGRLGVRPADEEVIGFNVTVDEVLLVDSLNAREL